MSLSINQQRAYSDIINQSCGKDNSRNTGIPPSSYQEYIKNITQETHTVQTSFGAVDCYVHFAKNRKTKCPVHINIHGGNFYFGHHETDRMYSSRIASGIDGIVVDIDYATSATHPFPTAFEQCYAVCEWTFSMAQGWDADTNKISIGGHGAGATITAGICLRAGQSKDFSFCMQLLDSPLLNCQKYVEDACLFTAPETDYKKALAALYFDGDLRMANNTIASPFMATDKMLKTQPTTVFVLPEHSELSDECLCYGKRLAANGVEVGVRQFLSSRPGFMVQLHDEWQEAQEYVLRRLNTINKTAGGNQ